MKKKPAPSDADDYGLAFNEASALDDEKSSEKLANVTSATPTTAVKIRKASPMKSVVLDPAANKKKPS